MSCTTTELEKFCFSSFSILLTPSFLIQNNHDAQTATSPISNTRQSPQYAGQTSNPSSPPFEGKRAFSPSPFPRPSTAEVAPRSSTDTIHTLNSGRPLTAATASMAALNNKEQGKGMRSRLRRAFSFGSTAELKRVTGEADPAVDRAKKRQEQFSIGLNDEQDAIARKQAAGGLGNSIYSGQGRRFGGSVDNLSISSTASSASMLVRKMNEGMKKSGRSIKGIFRPKSVIGVPAADRPSRPSVGSVSFVNVEAEREIVNVNSDPHDQAGGGTGFPRLERNSLDMDAATRQQQQQLAHQDMDMRSIAATENPTRAVILPSGKRGILKRRNQQAGFFPKTIADFLQVPALRLFHYQVQSVPTAHISMTPAPLLRLSIAALASAAPNLPFAESEDLRLTLASHLEHPEERTLLDATSVSAQGSSCTMYGRPQSMIEEARWQLAIA